jgi:FkbH-like protein
MDICNVPVTAESAKRREMYHVEAQRQIEAQGFGEDYVAFLRHCKIQLQITALSDDNLQRVHELTQRTNQMNFSGNRYDLEMLRGILSKPWLETYVMTCNDKFGSYGVVGFGIVDSREPRLIDLMFSCRVQSKRIEHAFLTFVIRTYISRCGRHVYANYRKSPRNSASGRVFTDVGMKEVDSRDGVTSLLFAKDHPIGDERIIEIITPDHCPSCVAS